MYRVSLSQKAVAPSRQCTLQILTSIVTTTQITNDSVSCTIVFLKASRSSVEMFLIFCVSTRSRYSQYRFIICNIHNRLMTLRLSTWGGLGVLLISTTFQVSLTP
ncbi:hypothetical protein ABKN59_002322 [Abortiporus biennis]